MTLYNDYNINTGFFGLNSWFTPLNMNFGNFQFGGSLWAPDFMQFPLSNFPMFNFNFPFQSFDSFQKTSSNFNCSKPASKNLNCNFKVSGNNIIPEGYNKAKGEKLGTTAWNNRNTKFRWYKGKWTDFTGNCAKYSKKDIQEAGLGKYVCGNGWFNYKNLDKNPNFKEIAVPKDYKKLPPGCALLFKPGSQGYDKYYGHMEISLGNGKAVSDGVSNNMRKPDKVYIPV